MFSDELLHYDWEETSRRIYSSTTSDVERAISKERLSVEDYMALISPAAASYLEPMAAKSRALTRKRFGNTIGFYIPLYLTNSCTNSCVYCGFNHSNPMERTILTEEEMVEEYKAIKRLGDFDNLLLVTGENPAKAGVAYIQRAIELAKPYFSNISIEVMPLGADDYYLLTQSGLNGVVCFQETYHRSRYNHYHPRGMKSKFEWRVNGYDRMGQAGVHKIGMGVLIGLEDWRTDTVMMAIHLRYLQKNYWTTRYSVNFPRMRRSESGFQPNVVMTDKEYAQLTFAFRLFDPDVDISMSTREAPSFRDNLCTLGVTSMSAGSKTEPGGYKTYPQALEQFAVSDERLPVEVEQAVKARGYEVVWKDWDKVLM